MQINWQWRTYLHQQSLQIAQCNCHWNPPRIEGLPVRLAGTVLFFHIKKVTLWHKGIEWDVVQPKWEVFCVQHLQLTVEQLRGSDRYRGKTRACGGEFTRWRAIRWCIPFHHWDSRCFKTNSRAVANKTLFIINTTGRSTHSIALRSNLTKASFSEASVTVIRQRNTGSSSLPQRSPLLKRLVSSPAFNYVTLWHCTTSCLYTQ